MSDIPNDQNIICEPEEFVFEAQLNSHYINENESPEDDNDENVTYKVENDKVLTGTSMPVTKGYPRFNEFSIRLMADQGNLEMESDKSAIKMLSKDLGYRLREVIHCSAQFMLHSSRTKLASKDVSKAMQELECDSIFGYDNSQQSWNSLKYQFVPVANVHVREDQLVNLKIVSSSIIWQRFEPHNYRDTNARLASIFIVDWLQSKHFICDNSKCIPGSTQETEKLETYFNQLSETLANINSSKFAHLSSLEKNSLLGLIYYDLSSNRNIKPVLHRFIKFAMCALRTLQRFSSPANIDPLVFSQTKLDSYNVYLKTMRALMKNKHFVDWSLQSDCICALSDLLLSICFDLRLCGDLSPLYHCSLQIRSQFAQLFGQILFKFCLPFSDLQNQLICVLYAKIDHYHSNISKLSWTERAAIDYSILLLHRYMGFDTCLRFLMPMLLHKSNVPFEDYFTEEVNHTTQSKVQANLQNVASTLVRGEICLVGELILKGLALLMVQVVDDIVTVEESNQIYAYFESHFGDTLTARLFPAPDLACVKSSRADWLKLWQSKVCRKVAHHTIVDKAIHSLKSAATHSKTEFISKDQTKPSLSTRNRKKKGTGLLESMLSTDTKMLAKNESLSMFTESLLEASHRQYEKKLPCQTFLYQEDYNEFALASPFLTSINALIVFEGIRINRNEEFSNQETDALNQEAFAPASETATSFNQQSFTPNQDTMNMYSPIQETITPVQEIDSRFRNTFSPIHETFVPFQQTFTSFSESVAPIQEIITPIYEAVSTADETDLGMFSMSLKLHFC